MRCPPGVVGGTRVGDKPTDGIGAAWGGRFRWAHIAGYAKMIHGATSPTDEQTLLGGVKKPHAQREWEGSSFSGSALGSPSAILYLLWKDASNRITRKQQQQQQHMTPVDPVSRSPKSISPSHARAVHIFPWSACGSLTEEAGEEKEGQLERQLVNATCQR